MISYLAGTIDQDFKHKFERLIFRTTRNTCQVFMEDLEYREGSDLAKSAEIDENGNMVTKSFFVIMYVGGMQDVIKNKLNLCCRSYNANKFIIPTSHQSFAQKIKNLDSQIKEQKIIISATKMTIKKTLSQFLTPHYPVHFTKYKLTFYKRKEIAPNSRN